MARDASVRYGWLIIGAVLSLFATHAKWDIALAAWLFPVFLLRFSRASRCRSAIGWLWLVAGIDMLWWLVQADLYSPAILAIGLALTPAWVAPFTLDRILHRRLTSGAGLLGTLVFPCGKVAAEFAVAASTPMGTILGVLGTTQQANLPLMQVVSVTGVYGISFLIAWTASVINQVWAHGSSPGGSALAISRLRTTVAVFGAVMAAVLLGGGARLAFTHDDSPTVRVAGVSASTEALRRQAAALRRYDSAADSVAAMLDSPTETRSAFSIVADDLFASTVREARAGAKIILWPESAVLTTENDRARLTQRLLAVSRAQGVYIDAGVTTYRRAAPQVSNQSWLATPEGTLAWTYDKAHPVPVLEPYRPGDGVLPTAATQYGTLSSVICYDTEFPQLMRQSGRLGVDIMLVSANNWDGIKELQAQNRAFRAVENGTTLVSQASKGISITYDRLGRTLATTDYFTAPQQTMIVQVPIQGARTLYSMIGDGFAWICVTWTATVVTYATIGTIRRSRTRQRSRLHPSSLR